MRNPLINRIVVEVAAAPGHNDVFVQIAGDVDVTGGLEPAGVVEQLAATVFASVRIDLAGITFAGAVLTHVFARVFNRLPDRTSMVPCRSNAVIRPVIHLESLDHYATVHADLPHNWMKSATATDESTATLTIAAA
jgi:hypothetical protein